MLGREWVLAPGCGGLADRQMFNLECKFGRIQSWTCSSRFPGVAWEGRGEVSRTRSGQGSPRTDRRRAWLDDGTEDGAADPRKGTRRAGLFGRLVEEARIGGGRWWSCFKPAHVPFWRKSRQYIPPPLDSFTSTATQKPVVTECASWNVPMVRPRVARNGWRPEGDRRGDRGPRRHDECASFPRGVDEEPHTQSTPVCKRPGHGWSRVLGKAVA
jgi:hypothetical protein